MKTKTKTYNINDIQKKFNTNQKCLTYLEKLRWGKTITCTFCGSANTKRLKNAPQRHHCNFCKKHFSVLLGTIFEHSRWELKQWFMLTSLILNAKKGYSAMQIQRNLGCSYKTGWYAAMRIRTAMVDDCHYSLQNIVEMDEAYVGGKPTKPNKRTENHANLFKVSNKRGRGTTKTPIVGIVERNGNVVLKVVEKLTGRNLMAMLKENVDTKNAIVVTDEFKSYKSFDTLVEHLTINHKKEFGRGVVHTNTIEGFWSIIKNSIKGQYVALSKKYLPLYLVQAQFIYNSRNHNGDLFEYFMVNALNSAKETLYYKPVKSVKEIAYPKRRKEAVCN